MELKRKEDYVVKGIGVSPGIVIGKAQLIERDRIDIFAYRLINEAEVPERRGVLKSLLKSQKSSV